MRWIIDYIRSCFCKHDYQIIDKATIYDFMDIREQLPLGERHVYVCKKCLKRKIIKTY